VPGSLGVSVAAVPAAIVVVAVTMYLFTAIAAS
jgi:hypothetical protein